MSLGLGYIPANHRTDLTQKCQQLDISDAAKSTGIAVRIAALKANVDHRGPATGPKAAATQSNHFTSFALFDTPQPSIVIDLYGDDENAVRQAVISSIPDTARPAEGRALGERRSYGSGAEELRFHNVGLWLL